MTIEKKFSSMFRADESLVRAYSLLISLDKGGLRNTFLGRNIYGSDSEPYLVMRASFPDYQLGRMRKSELCAIDDKFGVFLVSFSQNIRKVSIELRARQK